MMKKYLSIIFTLLALSGCATFEEGVTSIADDLNRKAHGDFD
ncbi:lipoprotein [Vibrio ichthyoenteri]|nr:lipoprotein [Vibrio ichthyoenteri]